MGAYSSADGKGDQTPSPSRKPQIAPFYIFRQFGSHYLSENQSQLPRNWDKVLFWSFYPWCHLVHNIGFHSLTLKHVDVTVPHSSEECSPHSFSVSFPKVDSNSVKHWELMPLLWDSLLLLT